MKILKNQIRKGGNKRRKEQRIYEKVRKQQNDKGKSLPTNNYYKCKVLKFPIKRHIVTD